MRSFALDVAVLDADDLRALRLGAQVLGHRAALEDRPRVATFFAALVNAIDEALVRRAQSDGRRGRRITLVIDSPADRVAGDPDDRAVLVDYVDLLRANIRLSLAVRTVCVSLGQQLRH